MNVLAALLAGLVLGCGLIVSGMANPSKVLGFFDLAGTWDPSLAFVMAGAIAIGLVAFRLARGRTRSLLGEVMHLPRAQDIDRRLVVGSALFGVGWGIAGICPGPAFVLLGAGSTQGAVFMLAMLAGMGLFQLQQMRPQAAACATNA